MSTAIAKTLGGNHSTVAREIVLLAGHLEATLFSGDMDGLMARAAQAAMATTAPIGLSKFEPAKYWTLAWGCLELVVAFSPPPIKPTTTESGVLQRIMAAIHYLVVAHSDTLRDAVTVSQEDDNVATKEMDKTGKTVGSAQMDAVVKIWGKGRPAVLFCGEAAASLEHARVTAFRSAQPHLQELFGDWSNGDVPKVEAPKDDWEYAEDYEVPATPKRPRVRRTVRYDIG